MNKAKVKSIIIYCAVFLGIILVGLVSFDVKTEFEQEVEYSSYTTKESGSKVLYLLSDEMGFDVRRYKRPSRFLPKNATVVAFAPDEKRFNDVLERKYLKLWLSEGNTMILIDDSSYIDDLKTAAISQTKNINPGNPVFQSR